MCLLYGIYVSRRVWYPIGYGLILIFFAAVLWWYELLQAWSWGSQTQGSPTLGLYGFELFCSGVLPWHRTILVKLFRLASEGEAEDETIYTGSFNQCCYLQSCGLYARLFLLADLSVEGGEGRTSRWLPDLDSSGGLLDESSFMVLPCIPPILEVDGRQLSMPTMRHMSSLPFFDESTTMFCFACIPSSLFHNDRGNGWRAISSCKRGVDDQGPDCVFMQAWFTWPRAWLRFHI